jgi:hypothetical protein
MMLSLQGESQVTFFFNFENELNLYNTWKHIG